MSMPRKARGRPFKAGNPGRPPGSKNKTTRIVEQLAEEQAENLIQKVLELALEGDVSSLRMLLDRIWPVRKGQPVNIDLPPIKTSQDLLAGIASVWTAIRDGRLTPDEASAMSFGSPYAARFVKTKWVARAARTPLQHATSGSISLGAGEVENREDGANCGR